MNMRYTQLLYCSATSLGWIEKERKRDLRSNDSCLQAVKVDRVFSVSLIRKVFFPDIAKINMLVKIVLPDV
jgi:hypothetical protein